jgi:hypothetical protein
MCQNYSREQVCNWMLPADSPENFCDACRLNQTIPDLYPFVLKPAVLSRIDFVHRTVRQVAANS